LQHVEEAGQCGDPAAGVGPAGQTHSDRGVLPANQQVLPHSLLPALVSTNTNEKER